MIDHLEAAPLWLQLVLLTVFATRLAILVADDRITRTPRLWAQRRIPASSYRAYLLSCYWCLGVWAGATVTAAWTHWPGPTLLVAVAGTISVGVPVLNRLTDTGLELPPEIPPTDD